MDCVEGDNIFTYIDMLGVHFTTIFLTQYVAIGVVFM
jgi:hypothetical protein